MSLAFEAFQRYAFAQIICNQKTVLDAGCKYGYGAKFLAQTAKEVTAVDVDQERLDKAKKDAPNNMNFIRHDLQNKLSGEYDVIVCLETLEHLKEPKKFLEQVKRLLTDGGLFVFSVPFGDRLRSDGSRIEEHLQMFYTLTDVRSLIGDYLDIVFLDRQLPMSFIGIAK